MNNMDIKRMKVGDEKVVDIYAGVDEAYMILSGGKRIRKNEKLRLSDENGREYLFEVKRIIGGSYIVLSERGKKTKLSFSDGKENQL